MTRYFLIFLTCLNFFLISGCAASDAAEEEQKDLPAAERNKPRVNVPPIDNGSAVAAKMISPVTGY